MTPILKDALTKRIKKRKTESQGYGTPKYQKLLSGDSRTWKLMEMLGNQTQFWIDKDGIEHECKRLVLFAWDPDKRPPNAMAYTGKVRNPSQGWWVCVKRFDYRHSARFYAICYAAIHGQPVIFDGDKDEEDM